MAKYQVLKAFRDIHTKEVYKANAEIEMTVKRATEVEKNLDSSFLLRIDQEEKQVIELAITEEVLIEFKERMRLGDEEDENLVRILSASNKALIRSCGNYDLNTDETFKELVFERSRYVYNDALEYFNHNFLSEINSLAIGKALEDIVLEDDSDAAI